MDGDLKRLFEFLAHEEAKHKLKFEKIYDDEILNKEESLPSSFLNNSGKGDHCGGPRHLI